MSACTADAPIMASGSSARRSSSSFSRASSVQNDDDTLDSSGENSSEAMPAPATTTLPHVQAPQAAWKGAAVLQ